MVQKILAGRAVGRELGSGVVDVQADQVVLARTPARTFVEAVEAGLTRPAAELTVAYEGRCATDGSAVDDTRALFREMVARGVVVGRAGAGFPGPVHLERFAGPARLCITDEPRLAGVGGIGMLALVVPTASLARALLCGGVATALPVSVQVQLVGRLRPFVCMSDTVLELQRRGLAEVVRRAAQRRSAPVVLEFAGPTVRWLSVGERSVLSGVAARVGAAASLITSDARTEVFLRDQRRSKAYRALVADAGAPYEAVFNVDLGAVDPLLEDHEGRVRAVRDLAGQPVTQVLLGGDDGVTLRDLLSAAALLRTKRVPSQLDCLVAVPSRQMLDVLAASGSLGDLLAMGARLIEPDARVLAGTLYAPAAGGLGLRSCSLGTPSKAAVRRLSMMASAQTLAYAVSTGELGDPRSFRRPARVIIPRVLPTDDVLIARDGDGRSKAPAGRALARVTPARQVALSKASA
jgi:aconitate hydratase